MRNDGIFSTFTSILMVIAAAVVLVPGGVRSAPAVAGDGQKEIELRYRGSDAVVLYDSLIVRHDAEGRISKRRHRAVMLLTDNAINRYGDPRILWNAATQELTMLAARVRMRDGTIVDTQRNGINQTTPFALDLTPDYADWQETVVTHMGIEKGSVAELHYLIADKNPSSSLSGAEVFSADDPTVERVLLVKLPPRMTLRFAPLSGAMPSPDTRTGGTWAWTVRDIPGRTPFAGGVWEGDYFPAVCYGTASTWREALASIEYDVSHAASSIPPDLSRLIREKTEGCRTDEDKALAVQRLAIESSRAVSAPYGLLSFPCRTARRIHDTGYASALDGAVLLVALLREAGFAPAVVLISAGRTLSKDVPAPELLSSVAVAVPVGNRGELLLDPSTPLERDPAFSLAGRTLVYLGTEPRLSPLPSKNIADSKSELTLALSPRAEGGWEGKGTAILTGAFSPYYLVRAGENGLKEFLKKRVSGFFGGADLVSWNPRSLERERAEVDFTFSVKLPERQKGERIYLAMPKPIESQLSGIERMPLERSQSADVIRLERCALSLTCAIELPAGWKMITERFSLHESGDIGEASVELASEPSGTRVFERRLLLTDDRVYPGSFDRFRSLLKAFGEDRIVLEKE